MSQAPTMHRFPDWPARLQALLAQRAVHPFAWGQHDCCLFVCDAIQAITGHDPAVGLRTYRTERGALRVLKQHGGVAGVADARLGPRIPVLAAQVGDAGLVTVDERDSLALCAGSHWLATGLHRLVPLPLESARLAWRAVKEAR